MAPSTTSMDFRSALRRLTGNAPESDAEAVRLLQALPDAEVRDALTDVFAEGEAGLPAALARALAGRTDARAVALLLPLLRDENPRVRNAARGILERVGAEAPGPVLDFSRDPDSRMRIFATTLLGAMPAATSSPRLLEMLSDADATVVDCAVAALGAQRAEAAVQPLAEVLHRNRTWIRLSALDALMRIGTPPAVRAILAARGGADGEIAPILDDVLDRLAQEAPPELGAEVRDGLRRARGGSPPA